MYYIRLDTSIDDKSNQGSQNIKNNTLSHDLEIIISCDKYSFSTFFIFHFSLSVFFLLES